MFLALLVSGCAASKETPQHNKKNITAIHFTALHCPDLSEDMSRISTKNDEIVMLTFHSTTKEILDHRITPMYVFSERDRTLQLEQTWSFPPNITTEDIRLTVFLVEVDGETFDENYIDILGQQILTEHFPTSFSLFEADELLNDDDLLGMKTSLTSDLKSGDFSWSFTGRQFFDPFEYQLIGHVN